MAELVRIDLKPIMEEVVGGTVENSDQLNARDTANRNADNHIDGDINGVYTLTERDKLAGIEIGATADQTKDDIDALGIDSATVNSHTVDTDVPSNAVFIDTTYTIKDGELSEKNFTGTLKDKLDGVETGATADQTEEEIKAAYDNKYAQRTNSNYIDNATNIDEAVDILDSSIAAINGTTEW